MKLAITGGGTGGHLAIAASLAEASVSLGVEVIFMGSEYGQDRSYFEGSPLFEKTYFFDTQGVVNKNMFGKLKALSKIFFAFLQARKILKTEKIDAIYSVGGFSASPASFAALSLNKPLFIHEQNAKMGRLNKLLKDKAVEFVSSYEADSPIKEYPVRDVFFQKARVRKKINTVLFLGGSQGARSINTLALEVAPLLAEKNITILHQSGKIEYEKVVQGYEKLGIKAEVFSFSSDIASYMSRADLAVSRSGASSLWELSATGLPALFIPYPYAAGDHQYYNALFLKEQNLAWVVRQNQNPKEKLLEILEQDLEQKSLQLQKLCKRGVAVEMIQRVVIHVEKKESDVS